MLTVKILGPGCANCRRLEEVARKAAADREVEAEFVKVTAYKDIVAQGIVTTPGLVIGDKVVSQGTIPTAEAIGLWLAAAQTQV